MRNEYKSSAIGASCDAQLIGANVIVVNANGDLLLQKRDNNTSVYPNMWALIGGAVEDYDYSIADAVVREVYEEAGIDVVVINCFYRSFNPANGALDHFHLACTGADDADIIIGEGKSIEFLPLETVLNLDIVPHHEAALFDSLCFLDFIRKMLRDEPLVDFRSADAYPFSYEHP